VETDLLDAWAAGFIDGEGYIYVVKRGERPNSIDVGIQCYQIERSPLERLQELYGGSIVARKTPGRRDGWSWRIHGGTALRVALPRLIPYLTFKRQKAELVLEYAEDMRPHRVKA